MPRLLPLAALLVAAGATRADGIADRTFRSTLNDRDVTVKVYTPPGYDAGTARYPVVYNLHGAGGGSPARQWDRVRTTLTAATDGGAVRPMIYVFVDGLGDTFFIDSATGRPKVASMIVTELIPWVDQNYRTVAGKHGRAADGFSMGGFGCLMLAFRHPELFAAVVSYGAALIDPAEDRTDKTKTDGRAGRWGDKAYSDRYNPRALAVANAAAIRGGLKVRVVCGDADKLYPLNVSFKDQLAGLRIPVDWVPVPGVAHDTKGLYDRVGVDSLRFIARAFDAAAPPPTGKEVGRGGVHSVVELAFAGPSQATTDTPARDIDFRVTFRHESGAPAHTVHGFFDGDGQGGVAGNVFKVRFCPTKPGRWDLAEVHSNAKELAGRKQGGHVVATPSKHPGFWEVDAEHAGGRWYKRTDGSHPYVLGNTQYSFLSGMRDTGPVPNFDVATDVAANAAYFKKLRFALTADRYPHPTEKPFLDAAGKPTDDGNCSTRPNPRWFHQRADAAVQAAYTHDLIADLILCGPDTDDARATLRASATGGDALPWLRYVAARYGSYPNVWVCLCNEYDIKTK